MSQTQQILLAALVLVFWFSPLMLTCWLFVGEGLSAVRRRRGRFARYLDGARQDA